MNNTMSKEEQAKKYAELLKKSLQSRDDSRFDRFVTQSDEMAQYEQRYTVGDKFWDMVEAEIEAATEQ